MANNMFIIISMPDLLLSFFGGIHFKITDDFREKLTFFDGGRFVNRPYTKEATDKDD